MITFSSRTYVDCLNETEAVVKFTIRAVILLDVCLLFRSVIFLYFIHWLSACLYLPIARVRMLIGGAQICILHM